MRNLNDKYDRQLAISFYTGVDDETITASTMALAKAFAKIKPGCSEVASVDIRNPVGDDDAGWGHIKTVVGELTTESRIYLNGHGDWQGQTLGNKGPKETAALLAAAGMPAVKTICITACGLGRKRTTGIIFTSTTSFASKFHAALKEKHGIKTEVHAYIYDVAVYTRPSINKAIAKGKITADDGEALYGKKATFVGEDVELQRTRSKRILTWAGNSQVSRWAY